MYQLTANAGNYDTLKKYSTLPEKFSQGKEKLLGARNSSCAPELYPEAISDFLEVANQDGPHTHKAQAYRLSAIAAKQARNVDEAKEFHQKGVAARKAAGHQFGRPTGDYQRMGRETAFMGHYLTQALREALVGVAKLGAIGFAILTAIPGTLICSALGKMHIMDRYCDYGDQALGKTENFIRNTSNSFEHAKQRAHTALSEQHQRLEGESSDEEWINGHDRKTDGRSTGKGLRHQFQHTG